MHVHEGASLSCVDEAMQTYQPTNQPTNPEAHTALPRKGCNRLSGQGTRVQGGRRIRPQTQFLKGRFASTSGRSCK